MSKPKIVCESLIFITYWGKKAIYTRGEEYIVAINKNEHIGVKCFGRTLPGGKVSDYESYQQAAARELEEETTLKATKQTFLFGGMSSPHRYRYTFITEIDPEPSVLDEALSFKSKEGSVVLATWEDLIHSSVGNYYQLLYEEYIRRDYYNDMLHFLKSELHK